MFLYKYTNTETKLSLIKSYLDSMSPSRLSISVLISVKPENPASAESVASAGNHGVTMLFLYLSY